MVYKLSVTEEGGIKNYIGPNRKLTVCVSVVSHFLSEGGIYIEVFKEQQHIQFIHTHTHTHTNNKIKKIYFMGQIDGEIWSYKDK